VGQPRRACPRAWPQPVGSRHQGPGSRGRGAFRVRLAGAARWFTEKRGRRDCDDVSNEATKHYDEKGMASLILKIATTNVFNRLNAVTKQVAGAWG
jgi:alkylhydroperoxidase family enzyme